ncbi:hypothetical protein JTF06_13785 [Desemzia sp. RIT804]|uniref:hypothetical protein n=1 Tax=Desemzia sp. RIT 804 TaxID=2810209 RepID=UPI00194EE12D|nr:hypothetical protein [Desemzia sp. RIT 804]MBM6615958.1 hypothetical protein [Desemzia sp. RIT 804]
MIGLSFILSDWMLGLFTFSEYTLGIVIALLVITGRFRITKKQIKWILGIIIFLSIHLIIHERFNDQFYFKTGIAAFIKLLFYIIIVTSLYNYIVENRLKKQFLIFNNVFAVLTCLIGWYIVVAIYSEGLLPFEFFWRFTRSDLTSYIFNNGVISFVRMRSIFSEPSYFGFYLNTILAMNYLNSNRLRVNWKFSIIISITILLTFSYSAIAIMFLSTGLYIFSAKREWLKRNKRKMGLLVVILLIILSVFYALFSDFFNYVFIQRTVNIFTDINNSGYSRLFGSWQYVNKDNILLGNGLGHTPSIWNIYAYMISDLGIFGLAGFILLTVSIIKSNKELGLFFIVMNFSKGGYLSSSFWLFLLLTVIYSIEKEKKNSKMWI